MSRVPLFRLIIAVVWLCVFDFVYAQDEPHPVFMDCTNGMGQLIPRSSRISDRLSSLISWHDADPARLKALRNTNPRLAERLEALLYGNLRLAPPFSQYSPEQLDTILFNLGSFQLENQCRVGCPFCAFSFNEKKPYRQFEVPVLRAAFRRIAELQQERGTQAPLFMLYYQSDPFDFEMPAAAGQSLYHYPDIHRLYHAFTGVNVYVSTAAPRGKESQVLDFVAQGLHRTSTLRISLSSHNVPRLNAPSSAAEPLSFLSLLQRSRLQNGTAGQGRDRVEWSRKINRVQAPAS